MKNQVFYISGPTATGKTAFAIDLAQQVSDLVFINADTMQLYRGLEPMAAHPTDEEYAQMEHRMYGVLDLDQDFSRREWLEMAKENIQQVLDEGKTPVLIGGSRSFAAELTKAAFDIQLDVDLDNATTFPEQDMERADFPYQLSVINIMPGQADMHDRILDRIKENTEASLDALEAAEEAGYVPNSPGFWVFGAKEYSEYRKGNCTLEEAQHAIADKTQAYLNEQVELFGTMCSAIRAKDPTAVLELSTDMPKADKVSETNLFMTARKREALLTAYVRPASPDDYGLAR